MGANFVLTLAMGRLLSPAEFGTLGLLVAIFLFASMPASAVQVLVVNRVARVGIDTDEDSVAGWLRGFDGRVALFGAALALATLPLSPLLKRIFNLDSGLPIVTVAVALAFWLLLTVNRGAMQGLREFNLLATSLVLEAVLRVGCAVVLVLIWPTAQAAAIGILLSCLAAWLLSIHPVKRRLGRGRGDGGNEAVERAGESRRRRHHLSLGLRESGGAVLALAMIAAMQNADVFAAKAHLSPEETGQYVAVATLGKAFFFFSLAITTAMLPVASASRGLPERRRVLARSAAVIGAVAIPAVLIAFAFSEQIVGLVYGESRADLSHLLGPITISSVFLALGYLIANYLMALGRTRYLPLMALVLVLEAGGLLAVSDSPVSAIVAVVIAANVLLALALGSDAVLESRLVDGAPRS